MEIDGQIWVFVPSFLTTTQIQSQRIFNIGLIWGEALNHINTIGMEQETGCLTADTADAILQRHLIVRLLYNMTAGKFLKIIRLKLDIFKK